jgi:hypothetical protein
MNDFPSHRCVAVSGSQIPTLIRPDIVSLTPGTPASPEGTACARYRRTGSGNLSPLVMGSTLARIVQ